MASLMDDSDDDELLQPSFAFKPLNVTSDMVDSVLAVCPDASREVITADLYYTSSAATTINRILDGLVLPGSHQSKESSSHFSIKTQNKFGTASPCNCKTKMSATSTVVCLSDTDIDTDDENINDNNYHDIEKEGMEVDDDIVILSASDQIKLQSNSTKKQQSDIYNTSEIIDLSFDDDNEGTSTAYEDNNHSKELKCGKTIPDQMLLSAKHNPDTGQNSFKRQQNILETSEKPSKHHIQIDDDDDDDRTCEARMTDVSSSDSDSDSLPSIIPCMKGETFSQAESSSSQLTSDVSEENPCVPKKKTKYSSEEMQKRKEQAQLKKEEKEKERQAKKEANEREKQAKQEALLAKRREKEMEKLLKKAETMNQKSQRKEECLQNIEVCLDPALLSTKEARDGNVNPIIEKLTSLGVSYSLQTHPVPESITWKRAAVEHTIGEDCQIHKQKTLTDETHVLVHLATDLFISMVDTFKKTRHGCSGSDTSSHSIESFRRTLSNAYDKKTISLVITGLNKYFRDIKSQKARQYRNAVRGEADDMENTKSRNKVSSPSSIVSQVDVEEFLVFVELTTELKLTLCETMQDFADNVSMVTKAIAEAPFKRSQPQAFSFCVDSSKSSVKVTKDGNGLIKLWQQQLQQFHNVSSNMAAAIVAAYPSPQLLIEAYKECSNKHSATLLLKDILVRRGTGVLATSRRIGPELSRQIYLLFDATDGETLSK